MGHDNPDPSLIVTGTRKSKPSGRVLGIDNNLIAASRKRKARVVESEDSTDDNFPVSDNDDEIEELVPENMNRQAHVSKANKDDSQLGKGGQFRQLDLTQLICKTPDPSNSTIQDPNKMDKNGFYKDLSNISEIPSKAKMARVDRTADVKHFFDNPHNVIEDGKAKK